MCGIAGIVGRPESVAEASLSEMVSTIAHRGPDHTASIIKHAPGFAVGLAYDRLSILDLSPAGNQPMANESGDIWVVYNGETYNHAELRRDLEARGHRYRSRTDTETIVHAYEEWGHDAFDRLQGMFALALYDQRTQTVLLARDRRGIKPLYYSWDGHTLLFASELKGLVTAEAIRREVDPTALWLFLCLGYVPSPYSLIAGVRKLEPGHYLELRDGNLTTRPFATNPSARPQPVDEQEAVDAVRASVEQAVQRHLMSDVPVGVFLSGGLDSTIVAALAARHHRGPLHTFSVGYAGGDGAEVASRYNEDFLYARQVAESLGTVHHEVLIENDSALTTLSSQLAYQLDEPMVEPVFTSTHFLSKLARQSGVPVILTGDGADELFGGYDRYFSAQRLATYRRLPGLRWALPAIGVSSGLFEVGRSARELEYLLDHRGPVESYIRFSSIYRPEQALALLAPDLRNDVDGEALKRLVGAALGPEATLADQMGHADLVLWVGEHFNPRLDRISMLHSVEARVPFQDEAVVSTALSLPMALKTNRRARKDLLKRAFADLVPEIARTRAKRSYQAPSAAWLQGGLRPVYSRLATGEGHISPLLDGAQLRASAADAGRSSPGGIFAAWGLLSAELWAERYLDGTTTRRAVHA